MKNANLGSMMIRIFFISLVATLVPGILIEGGEGVHSIIEVSASSVQKSSTSLQLWGKVVTREFSQNRIMVGKEINFQFKESGHGKYHIMDPSYFSLWFYALGFLCLFILFLFGLEYYPHQIKSLVSSKGMATLYVFLALSFILPVVSAGTVTRSFGGTFFCPKESGKNPVTVTLTTSGMSVSAVVQEYFYFDASRPWEISNPLNSVDYFRNDILDPGTGLKIGEFITFIFGPPIYSSSYTVKVDDVPPSGGIYGQILDFQGIYAMDTDDIESPILGDDRVMVRSDTCSVPPEDWIIVAPEHIGDEQDGDGYGPGCGCAQGDCEDNPFDDAIIGSNQYWITDVAEMVSTTILERYYNTSYTYVVPPFSLTQPAWGYIPSSYSSANIHAGTTEIFCNGIDDDCSGGDCCPIYYQPSLSIIGHYEGRSPLGLCNGLDDTERNDFLENWFDGVISPDLNYVLNEKPSTGKYWSP